MREKMCGITLASDAFTTCPSYRSSNYLREMSFDVYCYGCGWDSSSAFVEVGGMDALIYEYEIKFQHRAEIASAAQRRGEEKQKRKIMRYAV